MRVELTRAQKSRSIFWRLVAQTPLCGCPSMPNRSRRCESGHCKNASCHSEFSAQTLRLRVQFGFLACKKLNKTGWHVLPAASLLNLRQGTSSALNSRRQKKETAHGGRESVDEKSKPRRSCRTHLRKAPGARAGEECRTSSRPWRTGRKCWPRFFLYTRPSSTRAPSRTNLRNWRTFARRW